MRKVFTYDKRFASVVYRYEKYNQLEKLVFVNEEVLKVFDELFAELFDQVHEIAVEYGVGDKEVADEMREASSF